MAANPLGSDVTVSLTIPARILHLPGTIVSVDPGMGFGVEFKDLAPEDRDELERWIQQMAASKV